MYSQNKSLTKRLTEKVKKPKQMICRGVWKLKYFILFCTLIKHLRDILCERCLEEESM